MKWRLLNNRCPLTNFWLRRVPMNTVSRGSILVGEWYSFHTVSQKKTVRLNVMSCLTKTRNGFGKRSIFQYQRCALWLCLSRFYSGDPPSLPGLWHIPGIVTIVLGADTVIWSLQTVVPSKYILRPWDWSHSQDGPKKFNKNSVV